MIDAESELEAIRMVVCADGEPDPVRESAARAELMARIKEETPGVRSRLPVAQALGAAARRGRRRQARRPRISLWSAGALSGVAVTLLAALILVGHDGAVQPQTAAAAVLERAAKAQAQATVSPLHLGPGQVWYVEDVEAGQQAQNLRTCKAQCYATRALSAGGSVRTATRCICTGPGSRPAPHNGHAAAAQRADARAARFSPRWSGVGPGYDQQLHYNIMLTAPTNIASLRHLLLHIYPPQSPKPLPRWEQEQIIFSNIDAILSEPRVPARMLSGLYRLLATAPGREPEGPGDRLQAWATRARGRAPPAPRPTRNYAFRV